MTLRRVDKQLHILEIFDLDHGLYPFVLITSILF